MKTNDRYRRVPTRFGPETRLVKPVPPAPFRATQETELERLKNRLLVELLNDLNVPEMNVLVRRAANEAAALAWVTPYPLLAFPELFEKKCSPPCATPNSKRPSASAAPKSCSPYEND